MEELLGQISTLESRCARLERILAALQSSDVLALALRVLEKVPEGVPLDDLGVSFESPLRDRVDFLVHEEG